MTNKHYPTFLEWVDELVTIIRPMRSTKPRGNNTDKRSDPTYSIRISNVHKNTIDEAAELVGTTRSEFIVWASYYTAQEILKQFEEYKKTYPSMPDK